MNTDQTAAAVCGNEQERRNYLKVIIGKEPPRMFTSWQVELLLSTAVDRLTVELLHKADAKTVLAMMEEINLIKEQLPEVFTPTADTPDYQQWQDAVAVKAHYFPELLTPDEKAITAQTAAPQPPKPEMPPQTAPAKCECKEKWFLNMLIKDGFAAHCPGNDKAQIALILSIGAYILTFGIMIAFHGCR